MGDGVEDGRVNLQKIVEFLKNLYSGKFSLEQTLWKYSIFPLILLYLISQLLIFNQKIGLLLIYPLIIFNYISWTGLDKIITNPFFIIIIKIVRFVLLLSIMLSPLTIMFAFSGYQG